MSTESYTVIITKQNCLGREYKSNENCPLAAAIREQFPSFPLTWVGGNVLKGETHRRYYFSHDVWNINVMDDILAGKQDSCVVTFSREL